MLEEGMKIKIFPETNVSSYIDMIHSLGFNCKKKAEYILITGTRKRDWDKEKLGRLIRKKRKALHIDREELAKKTKVHEQTVFNWEVGRTVPVPYNINEIKKILDINEEELEECRI